MEPFEIGRLSAEPGTRVNGRCEVAALPDGNSLGIPMIIVHGTRPGPVLYLNAGTHGDEPEGAFAIFDTAAELDPNQLSGTLVGIPVLNVPAVTAKASVDVSGTRETPLDWKNMARIFPGKPDGTMTERIAYTVCEKILRKVDVAIDCHSGGTRGTSHWITGYAGVEGELSQKSLEIAELFPLKTLWRVSPWAKFASCCTDKGVTVCVVETTGEGRADDDSVAVLISGFRNVMKHLGMIEGQLEPVPQDRKCIDSETYLYANHTGYLRAQVETGQLIQEGARLGVVQDFYGNTKQEVHSPLDGIVTGIRTKPMVWAGEPVFLVANFIEAGAVGPTQARTDVTPP